MKLTKRKMDNLLKVSVVFSLILISLSVFYYFVFFLPKKQKEASLKNVLEVTIEDKSKCQEDGEKFYQKKKKEESPGSYGYSVFGNPAYVYSPELQTCLISWEDMLLMGDTSRNLWISHITNIYTNTDVDNWIKTLDKNGKFVDVRGDEVQFNLSSQKYFESQ